MNRLSFAKQSGTNTAVLLLSLSFALSAPAADWGPWSATDDAPVIRSAADRTPTGGAAGTGPPVQPIGSTPFLWLLSLYQHTISGFDGGRCPMYPTCSQYSREALHRHGPFLGIIMTTDRLIHEGEEQKFVQLRRIGSRYRYLDPLEENDFWWKR